MMTMMTGRSQTENAGRAGFTLVEVLVAMSITGMVATALVSLLMAQSRFYQRTDDQISAEQTAQATFDLVSAELRMAGAGDLMAAASDSVTIRFDIVQAVVCDSTGSDEATLYVYDRVTNANLTSSFFGVALSLPYEVDYEYEDGWNPTASASGSGPKADCVAAGESGAGLDTDYLRLTGWGARFTGGVPERGAIVRGYGKVTFRIAASTFFTSRWALWRGTQELIGPFDSGAAFSYVMDDGSVQTSVVAADFSSVAAIRFTATALGNGANRYDVERPVAFEVPFRN